MFMVIESSLGFCIEPYAFVQGLSDIYACFSVSLLLDKNQPATAMATSTP